MTKYLAALLLCLFAANAEARAFHGGAASGAAPAAPILQSVSVPFGAITPEARGYVFLPSLDVTTTANQPVTFSGLDLWVGGSPCATWTQTFSSGRSSGDYYLIATDTPNASAITPSPSSTGAGNLTGTYVFSTTCKDAGGHVSNTVNLTYVTVPNAVNLGAQDRTDFGVTPSGFGSVAGAQILLSVGADFSTSSTCCTSMRFDSGTYANQVTIKPADVARPPYLVSFQFIDNNANSGMANYRVTGLTLSGQLSSNENIVGFLCGLTGGCDNIVWDNIHGHFSEAYSLGTFGAGNSGNAWDAQGCKSGATACGISDSDFDYVGNGYAAGSNSYVHNVWIRHYYNNCTFFGNVSNFDIQDGGCIAALISPIQAGGGNANIHVDNCQVGDGATPDHVTIKRFLAAQGDGNTQVQGCPFPGSLLNTNCYVDDGTGTHGPGIVLTCPSGFQTSSSGSLIAIPSASIAYASNVRVSLTSSTTGTLSNLVATNIGSPGSPVATYGAGTYLDWNIDGLIVSQSAPNGFETQGEGGTSSVQDFALFQQNATPAGETTFTGSIDNATAIMTVTTTPTMGNYPGQAGCMVDCGRVSVPGFCDYCGPNVDHQITGSHEDTGTYQLSSWGLGTVSAGTTIKNSNGYPLANNSVGAMGQGSFCAVPGVHTGTYAIKNGTVQAGGSICGGGITNTTTSNWLNSSGGAAMPAANYASGVTPQVYLQSQTWSSRVSSAPLLTNAQILTLNCLSVKPKIGGGLDRGAGLWLGPVTGETNAGTHTGGGNWTTNNGTDSGIAIPGCSAAP